MGSLWGALERELVYPVSDALYDCVASRLRVALEEFAEEVMGHRAVSVSGRFYDGTEWEFICSVDHTQDGYLVQASYAVFITRNVFGRCFSNSFSLHRFRVRCGFCF